VTLLFPWAFYLSFLEKREALSVLSSDWFAEWRGEWRGDEKCVSCIEGARKGKGHFGNKEEEARKGNWSNLPLPLQFPLPLPFPLQLPISPSLLLQLPLGLFVP